MWIPSPQGLINPAHILALEYDDASDTTVARMVNGERFALRNHRVPGGQVVPNAQPDIVVLEVEVEEEQTCVNEIPVVAWVMPEIVNGKCDAEIEGAAPILMFPVGLLASWALYDRRTGQCFGEHMLPECGEICARDAFVLAVAKGRTRGVTCLIDGSSISCPDGAPEEPAQKASEPSQEPAAPDA